MVHLHIRSAEIGSINISTQVGEGPAKLPPPQELLRWLGKRETYFPVV